MKDKEVKFAISYLAARREEQIQDNIKDPACKATKKNFTAHGVDYHVFRKPIAKKLKECIVKSGSFYSFTAEGHALFSQILATGIYKATVMNWLRKYENFNKFLYVTYTVN